MSGSQIRNNYEHEIITFFFPKRIINSLKNCHFGVFLIHFPTICLFSSLWQTTCSYTKQVLLYGGFDKDHQVYKVYTNRYVLKKYYEYRTLKNINNTVILMSIRSSKYSIQVQNSI